MSFRDKNPPRTPSSMAASVRSHAAEPPPRPTAPKSLTETAIRENIDRRLYRLTGTADRRRRWYLVLIHPGKLELFVGALHASKQGAFSAWDYVRVLESGDGDILPDGLAAKWLDRLVAEKMAEIARSIESASDSPTTH